MGLDRYIYMSLGSSLYWYIVLVAHVKYDMGELGRGWWNNTVTARIVIVMWCQNPQIEEKSTHAFKESVSFSEGFFSEWLAVWLLGLLIL